MKRKVLELRPTQFAVGMYEVEERSQKIRALKSHELEKYLEDRPVPVVLCHQGEAHVVDRHHLVRACWEAGVERVVTKIEADLSHLDKHAFWEEMKRRNWTHLQDQFGKGPHPPQNLPLDVRGLADDVFRSLAWAVREAGGYAKTEQPFCEFHWADFFRPKIQIERTTKGIRHAVGKAMELACSNEAKHLPGFLHKKSAD